MEPGKQPSASRLGIVHVHDQRLRWGVLASRVVRIATAAQWRAPAVDVLAAIGDAAGGAAGSRGDPQRVVVVRDARGREIGLAAAGPIDIGEVDATDVLALPSAFAACAPHISAIIALGDGSLSLLLEPSAATFAEDIVLGEDLCRSRL